MAGPFQTPFTDAQAPPSTEGSGVTQRGGYDLGEGSQKETPNQSDIPLQPDLYSVGPGDPGRGTQIDMPDLTTSRTIKTAKD